MRKYTSALLAASALVLGAASANAQGYEPKDGAYTTSEDENVEISVPRYVVPDKSGTMLMPHSLSQQVRYDDLDLRTAEGAYILRSRARLTARLMCQELDERFPLTYPDPSSCYHISAKEATYAANATIDRVRFASNETPAMTQVSENTPVAIPVARPAQTAQRHKTTRHYASTKSIHRYASND